MKKKTATQKYIDQAAKQAAGEITAGTTINDCDFSMTIQNGDAVVTIAEALKANANALNTLAQSVSNQKVTCVEVKTG